MQNSENLEESLRETACLGDVEKVGVLVCAGVNVNSQNTVNGWTALHWAARRNHKNVVAYLLQHGAKPTIPSFTDELAADITQSKDIRCLLLGEESKKTKESVSTNHLGAAKLLNLENHTPQEETAGFVPNYLLNPEFPYSEGATEFANRLGIQKPGFATQDSGLSSSGQVVNGNMSQCGDNIQVAASDKPTCSTASTNDSVLVLKCRLADSEEKDFIEIELHQKCLNFEALVEICATELIVDRARLKKIRKLPNTIIRNDRDVKRLVQNQEIEIVIN